MQAEKQRPPLLLEVANQSPGQGQETPQGTSGRDTEDKRQTLRYGLH